MSHLLNHLINETSPYLLQHAHNPVNWYPWGDEALKKAKSEDKPILVSIGYSACHWCHVMEKESFEDEATATVMNDNFINIKIDREERPDLDHIYMDAVQAMSGSGGWPLNVFLTPDRKPFYGGTYFPPVKAFNRSSWKEVLLGVSQLFKERRSEAETQAEQLTQHIEESNLFVQLKKTFSNEEPFTRQQAGTIFNNIMKQADTQWGGFGNAPKFPQTFTINYLLRFADLTKNKTALNQACLSLDKMIDGGIYDQVGGGFSRYSTDTEWLAPHFEKMLYDNALIISSLCDTYQLTGNEKYKKIVNQTIKFIERELMNEGGGFYSALDADSEGEEGKYYVWSYDEVNEILGENAALFCAYYNVSPGGNWEHKNILRVVTPFPVFAMEKNMEEDDLEQILQPCSNKILLHRQKRIRPGTDDKILLGWNALMITSLCKAFGAFGDVGYKEKAISNFNFIWSSFKENNEGFSFHHTYKNNVAKHFAFLDDYAYFIQACIHLQEITSDTAYLEQARSLTQFVIENFTDDESNYFFYTNKKQTDVIIRKKEIYDGAIPSGNSVMAANLMYLSVIYNNNDWKNKSMQLLKDLSEIIIKYPTSFCNWACLLIDHVAGINEIAIAGAEFEKMRDELLASFIPNKVLQCCDTNHASNYPLLSDKKPSHGTLIYVCRDYSCKAPLRSITKVVSEIKSRL